MVFGGGAEKETVALPPCGEEAFLVVSGHGEPEGLVLEVIEDFGKFALKRFDLVVEWLLEVEEGARSLTGACGAEGGDPNIGGVEVAQEVCGVTGVNGREGGRSSEASAL